MDNNLRDQITNKMLNMLEEDSNFVLAPIGVWAVFAMSGYSVESSLKNIDMDKDEAFKLLETYSQQTENTDELTMANMIWAKNFNLILAPESKYIETTSPVPSQQKANEIVNKLTEGLITEYPGSVDGVDIAFTNVLTMIFNWAQKFTPVPTPENLPFWETDKVLSAKGNQYESGNVEFVYDDEDNLFAVFSKYSQGSSKVISIVSTDDETRKDSAFQTLQDIVEGKKTVFPASYLYGGGITRGGNFSIDMVKSNQDYYDVKIPAWDIRTLTDLSSTFNLDGQTSLVQEAVAQYQTEGFKAAAATSMMMMSMMPIHKKYYTSLQFDKPFASAAVYRGRHWNNVPAFLSWTGKAVEPNE